VHLVEDIVAEKLENVSVACLRPTRIHIEPKQQTNGEVRSTFLLSSFSLLSNVLWALVDEPKLHHEAKEAAVLEFL
jgi:hypothetical protein